MNLLSVVLSHGSGASSYLGEKEKTAYASTTLYLTGVSWWVLHTSFWDAAQQQRFTLTLATFVAVAATALAWIFVTWQLRNRRVAAVIQAACINVAARIVANEFPAGSDVSHRLWNNRYLMPAPLVTEIGVVEPQQRSDVQTSERITHVAIALWAVLLLARLVSTWRGVS